MGIIEVSAKTVEEAIESALSQLGLDRSEVEIEVLQEGKSGLFGFGGEEARIRAIPVGERERGREGAEERDATNIAKGVTERLLSLMQVSATVQAIELSDDSTIDLDITDGDLGLLIGRQGQTIFALQHLVNSIVNRELESKVRISVDVAGYRKRHNEELQNLAQQTAELVKSSGRSITLEPMPTGERRIVHLALRDDLEVATKSMGFGEKRKVVIYPRKSTERTPDL